MNTKLHKSTGALVLAAALAGFGMTALAQAPGGSDAPEFPNVAPRIVSTTPKKGAKDVDPALKEITVTFDRDMAGGMSWTGGGPDFPKIPEGKKAHWRNARTCALPVKLVSGHHYRVGINAPSYHNFRGTNGLPAAISAILFTTSGPKTEDKTPEIAKFDPPNGAGDVSPSVTELRVTFSVPMGKSFSWTGGGPSFPTVPDGKKPYWTEDGKTCVLPVELKPGGAYELGLNSLSYHGFKSAEGVPLEPVDYSFRTSGQP